MSEGEQEPLSDERKAEVEALLESFGQLTRDVLEQLAGALTPEELEELISNAQRVTDMLELRAREDLLRIMQDMRDNPPTPPAPDPN